MGTGEVRALSPLQGRAAARLSHVRTLAYWRHQNGDSIENPGGWLRVVVDSLSVLHGAGRWQLTTGAVWHFLPTSAGISDLEIAREIARPRQAGRILSNATAGRLVGLLLVELVELEAAGTLLVLEPIDESPAARALRRADRQRANTRARNVEYRESKRCQRASTVTGNVTSDGESNIRRVTVVYNTGSVTDRNVTFRSEATPAAVMAAVEGGASTIPEIITRTGAAEASVKMALRRLSDRGLIQKVARGRYAAIRFGPTALCAASFPNSGDDK